MDKHEVLRQIAELIDLQEDAIQRHPAETAAVYAKGRDAFIEGQWTAKDTDWSRAMSLTLEELSLMSRYMLSSSFISAWCHLTGDKGQRDRAAHSCSTLVGSLGPTPEQVLHKYIQYEQLWRRTLKKEGVVPRQFRVLAGAIIALIVAILLMWLLAR